MFLTYTQMTHLLDGHIVELFQDLNRAIPHMFR